MRFTVNHFNIKNVKLVLVNPKYVTLIKTHPFIQHSYCSSDKRFGLIAAILSLFRVYYVSLVQYKREWDQNLTYVDV